MPRICNPEAMSNDQGPAAEGIKLKLLVVAWPGSEASRDKQSIVLLWIASPLGPGLTSPHKFLSANIHLTLPDWGGISCWKTAWNTFGAKWPEGMPTVMPFPFDEGKLTAAEVSPWRAQPRHCQTQMQSKDLAMHNSRLLFIVVNSHQDTNLGKFCFCWTPSCQQSMLYFCSFMEMEDNAWKSNRKAHPVINLFSPCAGL